MDNITIKVKDKQEKHCPNSMKAERRQSFKEMIDKKLRQWRATLIKCSPEGRC